MGIGELFERMLSARGEAHLPTGEGKHARAVAISAIFATLQAWIWALTNFALGYGWLTVEFFVIGALFATALIPIRRGLVTVGAIMFFFVAFIQVGFSQYFFGYDSGSWVYLAVLIVVAFLVFPRRQLALSILCATISALILIAVTFWQDDLPVRFITTDPALSTVLNIATLCILLGALSAVFVRAVNKSEDALVEAHRRSDELLLNAIPESIAERLKDNGRELIADRHPDVSIMFVDVAGFTELSARQDPTETVNLLNALFSDFDNICDQMGIEKIRTIGDGYMVVGGAPQHLPDHTIKMADAAMSFLHIAQRHNINIRIGINAGEVVAGIVGTRRFHYDVWGDAVNVAARLETSGEVGKVHVSEEYAARLPSQFKVIERPPLELKGKGIMQTCFIEHCSD
jgi:adenylate cyclase